MPVTNYFTVDGAIIGESTTGSSPLDYVRDALGSVIATIDQTQTVQCTARYKPYGDILASTGTQPRFGWNGTSGYLRSAGVTHSECAVQSRLYGTHEGLWSSSGSSWPSERISAYIVQQATSTSGPSGFGGFLPGFSNSTVYKVLCRLPLSQPSLQATLDKNCQDCGQSCSCTGSIDITLHLDIIVQDPVPLGPLFPIKGDHDCGSMPVTPYPGCADINLSCVEPIHPASPCTSGSAAPGTIKLPFKFDRGHGIIKGSANYTYRLKLTPNCVCVEYTLGRKGC